MSFRPKPPILAFASPQDGQAQKHAGEVEKSIKKQPAEAVEKTLALYVRLRHTFNVQVQGS